MTPPPLAVAPASRPVSQTLSCRVLHSFADAEPFRSAWNDLVRRSGADVYQTFDWCRLWWQHYGTDRQLELLLFFSGDELSGIVPAFIEVLRLGPARLIVAKLVGADFTLHLCNLPVPSEILPAVISQSLDHFLGRHCCDALLLGPFAGPTARVDEFLAVGERKRDLVECVETIGDSCNTYFDLPDSFDDYLKAISKQQRYNFHRKITQFAKLHQVTFDVQSEADEVGADFETFRLLHDNQWRTEGKLGHFRDWPHAADFNRDLVHALGTQGMVRFHRILADDQVVSSQFSFVFGGTTYWRLPARAVGPEWDRFSFGSLGLIKLFEASINEGRHHVEGGRGHYEYKLQLGGRECPLRTVQFVRRDRAVATRVRVFKFVASQLDLIYYKVLFARLAPRIPALQRPLWPVWIRSTWW